MAMSRQRAVSITRAAQIAAVLAALSLGLLAVQGLPATEVPIPKKPEPVAIPTKKNQDSETKVVVDADGIGKRMANIANAPKKLETTPVDGGLSAPPPKEPDFTPGDSIKYIGGIRVGSRHLAVVNVSGKQTVFSEGKTFNIEQNGATHSLTVKAVTEDAVTVSEHDKDYEIPLESRVLGKSGKTPSSGPAGPMPTAPGAPGTVKGPRVKPPTGPRNVPVKPGDGGKH